MCFDPPERRIADSSPVTVVDLILEQATAQPDHPAIVTAGEPDSVITYAELAARVRSRTDALQRAGLQHAERCGLVAQQGPGFIEAALAIMATGACVVPIPDDLSGIPLETFANRAYLHKLVLEREDFACRAFAPGAASASGDRPPPEEEFRALEPAYLRFTSGTTSVRKGVVLSHETILRRLDGAQRGLSILPEDKILWLLPMAHHFVVSILLYLRHGATVLLPKSSLARDVLDLANRHGATFLYASPYHYGLLAKDASAARLDTTRLAISTAEGLRADTADRFRARFGFPLVQALGIIEVGLSVLNRRAAARKPGALGEALPDYRILFLDDNGAVLERADAPERTGEICIQGPGLFDAYLAPWIPAKNIVEPHGFRTGDQGWIDPDGDLHLAGRRANRINMAGMKFFGEEVEAILDTHPGVRASRVFGQEHPALGEIPVAEIVVTDPAHAPGRRELLPFCREHLPAYKIPRQFRVVAKLPETATGKIQRSGASAGTV